MRESYTNLNFKIICSIGPRSTSHSDLNFILFPLEDEDYIISIRKVKIYPNFSNENERKLRKY